MDPASLPVVIGPEAAEEGREEGRKNTREAMMHECEPPPLIDEYTRSAFTGGRAWPKVLSPQHSRDCARNPSVDAQLKAAPLVSSR